MLNGIGLQTRGGGGGFKDYGRCFDYLNYKYIKSNLLIVNI